MLSGNMDDALNVDIDPDLLLSYELDKLNLDSIPSDICDSMKLTDEGPKSDVKIAFSLKDNKVNVLALSNSIEIKTENISAVEDETCDTEIKAEFTSECAEVKKDINGNDESASEQNLNACLAQLELSDSDNEEIDDADLHKNRERGPLRPVKGRRANRRKDADNCKSDSHDKSQFNSERLKFWSGSSQIQFSEFAVPNQYPVYNSHAVQLNAYNYNAIEPIHNLSSQESYFEDARASSVSSPESGYDSSSAHSITGSPPPILFTSSVNLDFIPETVDEQNILDFLIENTDSALIDNNLAACNINDKDAKGKITQIINFLKDIPSELCESSNSATISPDLLEAVPFPNHSTTLNTSDVRSSSVLNTSDVRSPTVLNTSNVRSSPVLNTSDVRSSPVLNTSDVLPSSILNTSNVISSPVLNTSDIGSSPISTASDTRFCPLSCNSILKNVEPKKLVPKLKDKAKGMLRNFLSQKEFYDAKKRYYAKILDDEKSGKIASVIYVEDEQENRTNLHNAVLNGKIEDIYSIVEIHKQYDLPFADINIRDKSGKTALDYAIQNEMTLVADYLKENTACQSVSIEK